MTPRRPDMSLSELLDDWDAKRQALEAIADACAVVTGDPPADFVRSIEVVARKALGNE